MEKIEIIMNTSGEEHYGSGSASEDIILLYEKELAVSFPESYKRFLRKYGTLSFNGQSFYGISKLGLSASSAPDVRFVTLDARRRGDVDEKMIVIKSSGYGPLFSIDTATISEDNAPVIVITELSFKRDQQKNIVAKSFEEFLLQEIVNSLE